MLEVVGAAPVVHDQRVMAVTASIGYATFPIEPTLLDVSWERAINLVDTAHQGGVRVRIAPSTMDVLVQRADFPWAEVAAEADLMVPMAYWTIYAKDFPESVDPVAYTNEALMLLRDRVGPDEPIHSAGGLLQDSGTDEVTAAVEAARQAGVIGVSMYSWSGVKPGQLVSMQEEPR